MRRSPSWNDVLLADAEAKTEAMKAKTLEEIVIASMSLSLASFKPAVRHMTRGAKRGRTLCGLKRKTGKRLRPYWLTEKPDEVTCQECLKR